MDTSPGGDERRFQTTVAAATRDAPDDVDPAEFAIESSWGSWDASHGVQVTVAIQSADRTRHVYLPLELTLAQARELAQALTEAVAARRAHPPTAPEQVLLAYNNLSFAAANAGGAWIDLADVIASPELAGMDEAGFAAALAETGDIELEAGPGPITVDGTAYTRMREIFPDRPSTT